MTSMASTRPISLTELPAARAKTEVIGRFLRDRLERHLRTLRPLFAPTRVLGKYGGGSAVPHQDEVLASVRAMWAEVRAAPWQLPVDLDLESLGLIEDRTEIFPFEYQYEARADSGTKPIRIESPVRWILTYPSGYSFAQVTELLRAKGERRVKDLGRFALHSMVMAALVERSPTLIDLLGELRVKVSVERVAALGKLPLVVLGSPVRASLPADDTIVAAVALSGVAAFIELVEPGAADHVADPLREQLRAVDGG